jgi:hypothetical protein
MNRCTCNLANGTHADDCKPAQDVAFAELSIEKMNAEAAYRIDPNPTNARWMFQAGREYSRALRERLDVAQARAS